jgi:hypothetical protein
MKPKDGAFASSSQWSPASGVGRDFDCDHMLIEEWSLSYFIAGLVASLPERGRDFRRSDPCNSNDFQDIVMGCGIEG